MKKLLCGILTIIMIIVLFVFCVALNIKAVLVDTASDVAKKEISTSMVDYISENTEMPKEEVEQKLTETLDKNPKIKEIIDANVDKIVESLVQEGKESNIDLEKDINTLIDESDDLLKDYNITITEEMKKEIKAEMDIQELNDSINQEIKTAKMDMPKDVKTVFNVYNFINSSTFKIIVISGIVVILALIGLLKKSYYKWLSNLGIATIISGLLIALLLPMFINLISSGLSDMNVVISTISIKIYGYVSIGLGVIAIILNIILNKCLTQKNTAVTTN